MVSDSFPKHGKQHPMDVKDFKTFSCAGVSGSISLTSQEEAMQVAALVAGNITPTPDEQQWFDTFRVGIWPNYFDGVQFARDSATLNQYFRQMTPNIGPIDINVNTDAVSALFNKIGPAILVTTFTFRWYGLGYCYQKSKCKSNSLL